MNEGRLWLCHPQISGRCVPSLWPIWRGTQTRLRKTRCTVVGCQPALNLKELEQMTNQDLMNHLFRVLKPPKEWAMLLQKAESTIHAKLEGRIPFSFDEVTIAIKITKDTVVMEELASRNNCVVIRRPRSPEKTAKELLKDLPPLVRKLTNGKKVSPGKVRKAGQNLLAYAEALKLKGIQERLF